MTSGASYCIAGLRARVSGGGALGNAYRAFEVPSGGADHLRVRCTARPWAGTKLDRLVFDAGGTWSLWRSGADSVFLPYSADEPTACGGEARIAPDWRAVEVFGAEPGLTYPLDELIFRHLLADVGALVLHAAAVLWRGQALVFAGPSGAGKTTISRTWGGRAGAQVLSDDRVVVRHEEGRLMAYGTPWHGTGRAALPAGAPLGGVYALRRSHQDSLAPLPEAEAVAELVRAAFLPHWDTLRTGKALRVLDLLVSRVPVVAAHLTRTADVEALWP